MKFALWLVCMLKSYFSCFQVTDQGVYTDLVRHMIENNKYRIVVNLNDLRRKNETRCNK